MEEIDRASLTARETGSYNARAEIIGRRAADARRREGTHVALNERVAATTPQVERAHRVSRFELAPPRHFVLPAVLLLLAEAPSYGYRLARDLEDLNFGAFDRPVVYRALGQLESDGLVESWAEDPEAGGSRRMYELTPLGARVLRSWIAVIQQKRDALDGIVHRYQATATIDMAPVSYTHLTLPTILRV